jgi:hypothetical protein
MYDSKGYRKARNARVRGVVGSGLAGAGIGAFAGMISANAVGMSPMETAVVGGVSALGSGAMIARAAARDTQGRNAHFLNAMHTAKHGPTSNN